MTKQELISIAFNSQDAGAGNTVLTKAQMAAVVDRVFTAMRDGINSEKGVRIDEFGSFQVRNRAARTGRNPSTGEPIEIAAKKVVQFRPAKVLSDSVQ